MKKTVCFLLSALLMLGLCACGGSDSPATTATTNDSAKLSSEVQSTPAQTTEAATEEATTEATEVTTEATEPPFVPQGKVEIEAASVPAKYSLKELGPVSDGEGTLTFRSDDLLVRYEKDENGNTLYLPVDHMGKQISTERYGYFEELLPGLFLVCSLEDSINNSGLLSEEGELLIPCESAIISHTTLDNTDSTKSQFLRVVYATEETENEDEAFFYSSNAFFSIQPQEGDKFYKGYAKIYDLESKRFVPDLTITNPNQYDTRFGGGLISVETVDGEKILYNASGKELFKSSDYVNIDLGDGFYILDYTQVFDTDGNLLFEARENDSLQIIDGSARFLCSSNYASNLLSVYDFYGNKVCEIEGPTIISSEANGVFSASVDDKAILYNVEGQELCAKDNHYSASYKGYGIWEFTPKDSEANSSYYLVNGTEAAGESRYVYELVNEIKEEGKLFSFYPWNNPTQKISIETSYADKLTDALVACDGSPKTLVDCFSGETLMSADGFEFANSKYIYAKIDGVYHVYELVLE